VQPDAGDLEAALHAARAGDVHAFNRLVDVHQRQIYNVCYRTLGSADDAEDATQDTFFSAFRNLGAFRGSAAGLRAWLTRVAVNACYDQLRRRQRRPTTSLDALEDDAPVHLPDASPGPESSTLDLETAEAIQAALNGLPPEQRLVVVLCDINGLSYEEAAHAMGVELGTVKSRLSRARVRLRDLLTAAGELPPSARRLEQKNA
jgi:RNA polymerase sigma factor (sigma-70 family)